MATRKIEGSVRERLLAAANELFYEEGIHTVGIDRVLDRAGVAKASLYSTFGSKDELVRAYLEARTRAREARIAKAEEGLSAPRDRILAVFDAQLAFAATVAYRGCPFVNARAEGRRAGPVADACAASRERLRGHFEALAREAGAADPATLARRLVMLYDGAAVGAAMDQDPAAIHEARALAAQLLEQPSD